MQCASLARTLIANNRRSVIAVLHLAENHLGRLLTDGEEERFRRCARIYVDVWRHVEPLNSNDAIVNSILALANRKRPQTTERLLFTNYRNASAEQVARAVYTLWTLNYYVLAGVNERTSKLASQALLATSDKTVK